jgi:L-threonylcarbamoyladenylate synthase
MTAAVDRAVAALHAGELAVIPTDTVYGLAASAVGEEPTRRLYDAKGRGSGQPTALLFADVESLLASIPELPAQAERAARAFLPGPFTLVLPNPARRFPWLAGGTPDAIGVRVPAVVGEALELLERAGPVVATSANLPGEPAPRRLQDVPAELLERSAAVVDGGELPGTASTVLDLTGQEPRVLREGAVPAAEALRRLAGLSEVDRMRAGRHGRGAT